MNQQTRVRPQFTGTVEFAESFAPHPEISHVLFDFDGTLSLIREGWPEVMVPMFAEMLPPRANETESMRRQLALDDIMRLNGKQTIYQMIQLCERIKERGGQPREPLWYKRGYLRRLDEPIHGRIEGSRSGELSREQFLVFGARPVLTELKRRELALYLASGTNEPFVKAQLDTHRCGCCAAYDSRALLQHHASLLETSHRGRGRLLPGPLPRY